MKIVDWLKDILGFGEDDFDDIEINFTSESAESIMESLAKASKKRLTILFLIMNLYQNNA